MNYGLALALLLTPGVQAPDSPLTTETPEALESIERSYTLLSIRELERLELSVDGRNVEARVPEWYRESLRLERSLLFRDLELADGELEREFLELHAAGRVARDAPSFEPTEVEFAAESELEGRRVRFDGDGARFVDEGAERGDLLEGLEALLALPELAPPDDSGAAPDSGDAESWTLPASVLGRLLAPGGALHLGLDDEANAVPGWPLVDPFTHTASGDLEGEVTVTLVDRSEEGEQELLTLSLRAEVTATLDRAAALEQALAGSHRLQSSGLEFDVHGAEDELQLEAEGQALWNATIGGLERLEWTSTSRLVQRREVTTSLAGYGETEIRVAEFTGSDSLRLECQRHSRD